MAGRRAGGQYCEGALSQPPIRSLLARSVAPPLLVGWGRQIQTVGTDASIGQGQTPVDENRIEVGVAQPDYIRHRLGR